MASCGYVRWEEVWVSREKGRREVHYVLRRRDGSSDLALVGKEKSLRHMFYHYALPTQKKLLASMGSSVSFSKLKSRKEVVDWLDSLFSDSSAENSARAADAETLKDNQLGKLGHGTKEFLWLGSPWTCKKRRNHYQSFKRNGFKISVYDFVYVLAEEGKRLVAYLEDMYEDSRGNRMVVVRWFHKIDEVGIDLPHDFCEREVFFSLYLQDLSIECIDGLASVVTPQHYEKLQSVARYTRWEPFICRKQFDNDDVKPFDVSQLKGYWKQDIIRFMCAPSESRSHGSSGLSDNSQGNSDPAAESRPKKRRRLTKVGSKEVADLAAVKLDLSNSKSNTKIGTGKTSLKNVSDDYLVVGSQVEVLSQDSGMRGCWFRASIVKMHKNKVKVQYQDIQDAVDETKKLEEWVLASKISAHDDLRLRKYGRNKIRPVPPPHRFEKSTGVDVGSIVDVWWHDGWWEGIVVKIVSEAKYRVYFPGEKLVSMFDLDNLRQSQEWIGNEWVKMRGRPDLVDSVLSTLKAKQGPCKSSELSTEDVIQSKEADACLDSEGDKSKKPELFPDLLKDGILSQLRWSSRKRRRSNGTSLGSDKDRRKSPNSVESDASDSFVIPGFVNAEHDDFTYGGDPSVFNSSVVPSLTNLVMCR
ncbi:uncharacterized protein LOC130948333 isoform X1 [Arachis stenosperma]|uniref:uncharacterized protein LOC130948333 isoform X1 n=1 Tax=Arachis stenosperma TaxID=217475 RepID=UPI0025AB79A1|nr:uncharacterized protein LOC130948333 isoform X1 [Arachis stenosperma]